MGDVRTPSEDLGCELKVLAKGRVSVPSSSSFTLGNFVTPFPIQVFYRAVPGCALSITALTLINNAGITTVNFSVISFVPGDLEWVILEIRA